MGKKYHFFAMLSRMKFINRWALMRNTHMENISEHSLEVATVAHSLAVLHNKRFGGNVNAERTAVLGVFHDAPEIITGDMPTPVKYYSKQTTADYNTQTNTFDISANWESKKTTLPGFIDVSTVGNADLFTLTFNGTVVTIDASTSGDEDIVTKIELYENSVQKGTTVNVDSTGICTFNGILTYTETIVNNANLLSLYKRQNLNVKPNHVLYTIKYAVEDETECTHIATYDRSIGGYTEYRKFPNISLRCYNDIESLEQLNNADNGILVNQFQTFVDLKIDDFT